MRRGVGCQHFFAIPFLTRVVPSEPRNCTKRIVTFFSQFARYARKQFISHRIWTRVPETLREVNLFCGYFLFLIDVCFWLLNPKSSWIGQTPSTFSAFCFQTQLATIEVCVQCHVFSGVPQFWELKTCPSQPKTWFRGRKKKLLQYYGWKHPMA